eukprot:446653_1
MSVGAIESIFPNPTYRIEHKAESSNGYIDKILVQGYVRNENISSEDIIHIIYLFALNIKSRSMTLIAATHLFASTIYNFVNTEQNKCEFVQNEEDRLNILQYIFVRGGMCRDLLLNQDIKDIDIVVNIHELSKEYLSHLTTFHSKKEQQNEKCQCIFWRHYLNKYKHTEYDPMKDGQIKWFLPSVKDKDFKKLFTFEKIIQRSEYLLNAKFIKSIVFGTNPFKNAYNDTYNNKFFSQKLNLSKYFDGLSAEVIQFDIVDQIGCHDNYWSILSMDTYRKVMGEESVQKALQYINEYNEQKLQNKQNILIPIHPFQSSLNFYDCTINCMHIDLYRIFKDKRIDLLWKQKIINTTYNHQLINKYNGIGFEDLNNKILRAANINVITAESAAYYFWRLLKMVTKFIDKLICQEWCIDEAYLNVISKHFDVLSKQNSIFHTKCLYNPRGGVGGIEDVKKRFVVFRYIKFEEYLKSEWEYHGSRFEKVLKNLDLYTKYRENMWQCFQDFGYPLQLMNTEIPKGWYDHIHDRHN